jgi:hypothetical protein
MDKDKKIMMLEGQIEYLKKVVLHLMKRQDGIEKMVYTSN